MTALVRSCECNLEGAINRCLQKMNTGFFFIPDSPACNGAGNPVCLSSTLHGPAGEGVRAAAVIDSRISGRPRNLPPHFLIRLAVKVSRTRLYSFLRRVFHYQNGTGSDLGPNPFDSWRWMLVEFMALTVQISVIAFTLIVSKEENPIWPMRIWVSGYAFGCFMGFLLLFWRYRAVYMNPDGSNQDTGQQRHHEESRNLQKPRTWLELLFALWFVMGNVWVFDSRFGSLDSSPKLHALCISLLAWNAVTYSFPFILFLLLCCCVPFLSSLLGYNMNMGSLDRSATDEQIACLAHWKYEDRGRSLELGNPTIKNEIQECCICLVKYREREEIRQLPCAHIFHLNCVDQWLKIISSCPLCKQQINK